MADGFKGPGYTVNDLVYWTGMMGGIIAVVLTGRQYGVNQIILLIGGLVVGAGLGFVMERAYRNSNRRPPSEFEQEDARRDKF
jgi:hypothetical protein